MTLKRLLQVILIPVLICFSLAAFSQDRTITGKVTDSKDGSPVVGASVVAKGTTNGTSTKSDGSFSLTVGPSVSALVITSVGYDAYEVNIVGSTVVAASLTAQAGGLSEVVVIGYGTTRKKDLTGAVSSVQAKDFNKGNYTAPDQLIQGKVAGVQVLNNTGQPGGQTTVKIRGNSAITGTGQPLYVVDGVPIDGRSVQPGFASPQLGNTPGTNPLNFLNPADIASMDILKDASATAIYGSRAAYGVIIITTKKGQAGQPRIDFNTSVGFSSIMKRIEVLSADQFRSALTYYGVSASNDKGANVDAMDAILQKGLQQNYNVAVSGGNENGRYRLSVGYLDQEGIIRKSDFRKFSAAFTASFKFLDSKKLGIDFSVIPSQYTQHLVPIVNDAGANGNLIANALQWNPTEALWKANDSLNIKYGTNVLNPVAMSEAYDDVSRVTTVLASVSPYFKFTNWLEYRMLYSINYSTGNRRASIKQYINLNDINNIGWATIANNELITQQLTHTLNFNHSLTDKLGLKGLLGYEYMKFDNKGSNVAAFGPPGGGFGNYGLDYTNYIQYSNSSNRTITSFADPISELQSFFARAELNYNDRFLVTATIRRDGSSKFGENNKYGNFPSFAAAWNISKEGFFPSGFVSNLKVRAGWGKTGNQEFPAGSAQAKYSFSSNGGLGQVNNPNEDLKWQADRQYNIGLDFGLFKSKLTGTIDYFNKRTEDLLFPSAPIQPAPPGSVVRWVNLPGNIDNKGVEVQLNANIIARPDLTWDFGVNATFIKNTVDGLPAPIATGALHGQGISGTTVQVIRSGLPINAFFTREFVELDKASGQAVYTDNGSTFYFVGDPNPSTLLGITTSLNYKKFNVTINMNGAFGQDIYNNTLNNVINVGSINGGRNIAVSVYESAVKESFANPVTASSRFIEKGGYLKMANATIAYNLGTIAKTFKSAQVYLTGQNLFVITDFTGFDPEVNVDKNVNGIPSVGIEYTPYPSARTIIFGLNFSF
jgi:TonB-linked SusC/RagA family outer membrane protein